ncbi:MAG TPA: N-acetylglucosamine-6-phosphate deacetylase [Terriglobales bacterium]
MIALTASQLYTPLQVFFQPLLLIEDGRIVEVTSRSAKPAPAGARLIDYEDGILAPGFIDIHIHGSAGHDVMNSDSAGLAAVEAFIARHGVTGYFPTTVTAPLDHTLAALDRLATAIEEGGSDGCERRARPLGIHLEGPFISHAKRGVHPAKYLQKPSLGLFERFWQASRGQIKMMTIAPELDGADEVIAAASQCGMCISLGHSDSELTATRAGVEAGARHFTHAFNAMRGLDHRDPGIVGEMLTNARLSADIIADGIHVDPVVVKLFLQAKGAEKAVLITDAMAATGMPDGRYRLGEIEVEVKDGRCEADGRLAGSVLTMGCAVRNAMKFAGWDLRSSLRLASLNPARVAGLGGRGEIAPGSHADLVVLSADGEVKEVITGGVV